MKAVYAIAFHPDGQSVISAGADGVLRHSQGRRRRRVAKLDVFEVEPAATDSKLAVAAELPPVEFLTDVMPVLGKLGCNAGTCHGSRTGQNGFKLSLRGYDPLFDVRALTDDLAARRINLRRPETSLMLLKATGCVPHGGQRRRARASRYDVLRRWIAEGAKLDLEAPRVVSISLSPQNPVLDAEGQTQAMKVLATYADGSERDVTAEAFIDSGNTEVRHGRRRRHDHRAPPRRGADARPLRRRLRRHDAHRHGRPHRLRLDAAAGLQPHRRAGRRQAGSG